MVTAQGVHIDSETYALVLGSLARHGYFHRNAESIADLNAQGFSEHATGQKLLDEIMTTMANDIAEISEEAAEIIFNGFHAGFGLSANNVTGSISIRGSLRGVPVCSNDREDLKEKGVSVGRVTVDSSSAICPSTGAQLRQLTLDQRQRQHVHDTLLKMSVTQQMDFSARNKNRTKYNPGKTAGRELQNFADWLR